MKKDIPTFFLDIRSSKSLTDPKNLGSQPTLCFQQSGPLTSTNRPKSHGFGFRIQKV